MHNLTSHKSNDDTAHGEPRARRVRHRGPLAIAGLVAISATFMLPNAASAAGQKLISAEGIAGDRHGSAVAVDGDTAVVGAPNEAGADGAVYVYQRTLNAWKRTGKLVASGNAPISGLGSSVAIDGDTIVAGADGDGGSNQGAVYTFTRTGAALRTQTAKLTASDAKAGDALGTAVAIDGDTIVAGASQADSPDMEDRGAVYTFTRAGAAERTQVSKLMASDGIDNDRLGNSVAIDGDTIVAGAYRDSDAIDDELYKQGSVYTFARSGAALRTETAKLYASDGANFDELGASVAIEGDTIVAGAPKDDDGSRTDQGSVYTFDRTGAKARTQTGKLYASDGFASDWLGTSVGISGATIVAGAPGDHVVANVDHGAMYTFTRTGASTRNETAKKIAPGTPANDALGFSVAIDGTSILGGAPRANDGRGYAYMFFVNKIVLGG